MTSYQVLLSEPARDFLRRLAPTPKRTLRQALKALEEDPSLGEPLERELSGLYKLSVKRYRIIYRIVEGRKEIQVIAIGPRKTIYLDLWELLRLSQE